MDDPMNDASLDREIESLLASEPSPEFVARVRARVAEEPVPVRWWLQWKLGFAAAAVVAITVIAVWPDRVGEEQSQAPTGAVVEREGRPAQAAVATAPPGLPVASTRASDEPRRNRPPRRSETATGLVPLVNQEDARAFDALLAAIRDRNVRLVFDDEPPASAPSVAALAIPPISIEPLPAILEGGVE